MTSSQRFSFSLVWGTDSQPALQVCAVAQEGGWPDLPQAPGDGDSQVRTTTGKPKLLFESVKQHKHAIPIILHLWWTSVLRMLCRWVRQLDTMGLPAR